MRHPGPMTFVAGVPLAIYRRVRLDENYELVYADAGDTDCIGITMRPALSAGDDVTVWTIGSEGTFENTSAGAFDQGATLYAADNGMVADGGTVLVGVALQAAAEDGCFIETLHSPAAVIGSTARSALAQEDLRPYPVPVGQLRVWDAPSTPAVAAAAADDDLAVVYNTHLTAGPTVETGDLKNVGETTRKIGFEFVVPPEYVAGQTITLRANAGMKTTVASVAATVDFQVARRAAPAVDVCATAAQSINSLADDDLDFEITPTDVVPGDVLDVVCSVAVNDSGTGTAVIGRINRLELLLDIKG